MKIRLLCALLALATTGLCADPDFAALARERQELDRRIERESQKIDQAQEQALIPVRAKVRELQMQTERAFQAASLAIGAAMLNGKDTVDTSAVEKAKFERLEVDNLENNQLAPESLDAFDDRRAALSREQEVGTAKIEAKMFAGQEGGAKLAEKLVRKAEITARWSEKIRSAEKELERATRKLQLEHTTRINRAEARIAALEIKAGVIMNARIREKAARGEAPMPADVIPVADPATPAAEAERDAARNALQTALEQQQADFSPRRTELENQRDEELAKIEG